MKSERKHTLESNLLADKIEQVAINLKKALPAILAVTAVVVVGLLSYGFYTSVKEKESAKGWTALYFADTESADLTAISSDFSGTSAALWAKQTAGDANMSRALEKVYLDRDLAEQFYKEAAAEYRVAAEKSTDPFLAGRANFGLAQASEGLGDLEQALSYYRKVIQNKAMGSELIGEAAKRVAWLESKAGEEFYAWYKTSRASSPVLNTNPPTNAPLPSSPNISFPIIPSGDTPAPNTPAPNTPATNTPAASVPSNALLPTASDASSSQVEKTLPGTAAPGSPKLEVPKVEDAPAEKKP